MPRRRLGYAICRAARAGVPFTQPPDRPATSVHLASDAIRYVFSLSQIRQEITAEVRQRHRTIWGT